MPRIFGSTDTVNVTSLWAEVDAIEAELASTSPATPKFDHLNAEMTRLLDIIEGTNQRHVYPQAEKALSLELRL